jgi:hypothetical protein
MTMPRVKTLSPARRKSSAVRPRHTHIWARDPHASIAFHKRDFLKSSPVGPPPWSAVLNPPFDQIKEFCERAVALVTYKVAVLVPLKRLSAAHWLKRLLLHTVYLMTPRPSIPTGTHIDAGGYVGGDTKEYCWLVFNKRDTVTAPQLRWLHRDGEI